MYVQLEFGAALEVQEIRKNLNWRIFFFLQNEVKRSKNAEGKSWLPACAPWFREILWQSQVRTNPFNFAATKDATVFPLVL